MFVNKIPDNLGKIIGLKFGYKIKEFIMKFILYNF